MKSSSRRIHIGAIVQFFFLSLFVWMPPVIFSLTPTTTTNSIAMIPAAASSSVAPAAAAAAAAASNSGDADFQEIARELQVLADTHAMEERQFLKRSRNKLQPRHMAEFPSETLLFDRFARVVCQVLVIPRKEIFETWAMALYVHHQFPHATRIADVACSHGLLSWCLLLLAHQDQNSRSSSNSSTSSTNNSNTSNSNTSNSNTSNSNNYTDPMMTTPRSVVCIDLKMPKSAEKIAAAMLQEWPFLKDSWDYVEGPLEALQPDASTLLVGIHACGLLSDKLVSLAIRGNAPLAIVPCCHSKKSLTLDQKEEIMIQKTKGAVVARMMDDDDVDAIVTKTAAAAATTATATATLADYIDRYRIQRLQSAGFDVVEARIPPAFTPKNRIIMAKPSNSSCTASMSRPPQDTITKQEEEGEPIMMMSLCTKGNPGWGLPKFCIPVADTPTARATVRDMAGRDASVQRQQDPPVSLHVSLLLPPDNINLSAQELTRALPLAESQVEAVCSEPFWHPQAQRHARTFKVTYPVGEPKKRCREYHQILRESIPKVFPGAQVRY